MRWRYKTILFEFHKDNVFGDRYIDEDEVESILNEQGADGWELVNVSLLREGLLAFCKKPYRTEKLGHIDRMDSEDSVMRAVTIPREPASISVNRRQPGLGIGEREFLKLAGGKESESEDGGGALVDDIPIR